MSELDPVVLFHVAKESFGDSFWPLAAAAGLLAAAVLAAAIRAARHGGLGRPLGRALIAGLVVACAAVFLVPAWTAVGPGALNGAVDIAVAAMFALVPGAVAAALAFLFCAWRGRPA